MSDPEPLLETRDLTKHFGGLTAVDSVDLTVPRNEVRSIIGPNGAGKSTTFDLINGFLSPSRGTIRLDGEDVTDLPAHERCQRGIGRSFQITDTFGSLSVRENVRIAVQATHGDRRHPLRRARDIEEINDRTDEVLAEMQLAALSNLQASELAYGDQRKLEMAMALASDPELLLLDEPTAGIGVEESEEIQQLISEIGERQTVLLTEHDIDMIMSVSDRITVLHKGSVIAEGTPSQIAGNEDVQQAYLGGMAR